MQRLMFVLVLLLCLDGCSETPQKGEIYDILQDRSVLKDLVRTRSILVWRSRHAAREGQFLIDAEVAQRKPETLSPYLACFVPHLTWMTLMPVESYWDEMMDAFRTMKLRKILITEGESAGCQGYVESRYIRPRR